MKRVDVDAPGAVSNKGGRRSAGPAPMVITPEAVRCAVSALGQAGRRPTLSALAEALGVHRKTLEKKRRARHTPLSHAIDAALTAHLTTADAVEASRREGRTQEETAAALGVSLYSLRMRAQTDDAMAAAWIGHPKRQWDLAAVARMHADGATLEAIAATAATQPVDRRTLRRDAEADPALARALGR